MDKPFTEGQWAWSPFDGWARVQAIQAGVYTWCHGGSDYTAEGRWMPQDAYPSLFHEALDGSKPPEDPVYVNLYAPGWGGNDTYKAHGWSSLEMANRVGDPKRIALLRITGNKVEVVENE